jgi:L-threonylcarbamoyladenylate synthase
LQSSDAAYEIAAEALLKGLLVVVPTETVYGLAVNALREDAVQQVFEAKGRPSQHPLITHIASEDQIPSVVREWPDVAVRLTRNFWPGPLTLVLPKAPGLSNLVTGGRPTAAIRMPDSTAFRAVISLAGVPIAAPSANLFTGVSPTRVEHLSRQILERVELVIDGGPCEYGIESTVLDLSEGTPKLLRSGAIEAADIEKVLGQVLESGDRAKAPGSHSKHYSPVGAVRIVEGPHKLPGLVFGPPIPGQIQMPNSPVSFAHRLYAALHQLDAERHPEIWVEAPPETRDWEAVWDRLRRASSD